MKNSFIGSRITKNRYEKIIHPIYQIGLISASITIIHFSTLLKLKLHHPLNTVIFITSCIKLTCQIYLETD